MSLSGGSAARGKRFLRLFDANLNRCREGLRVIEDTGRFVLLDKSVYIKARKLRHLLDRLTRPVYPELLEQRDAVKDSGRKIKEGKRESLQGILSANFRRAEEALRVLEEYGKYICPEAAPEFKASRYEIYSLEKKVLSMLKRPAGK